MNTTITEINKNIDSLKECKNLLHFGTSKLQINNMINRAYDLEKISWGENCELLDRLAATSYVERINNIPLTTPYLRNDLVE